MEDFSKLNIVTGATPTPRRVEAFSKLSPDVLGVIVAAGRLTPRELGALLRALLPSDVSQAENPIYRHLICELRRLLAALLLQNGFALKHIPAECCTHLMYDLALRQDGDALVFVPAECLTPNRYLQASKTMRRLETFYKIPKEFRTMKICLNFIRCLNTANFPMCAIAVDAQIITQYHGEWSYDYISNWATYCPVAFWAIPGVAAVVAKICGLYIAFIPARLLTHRVLRHAVKQNGEALGLIDPDRITRTMCRDAVRTSGETIIKLIPCRFDTPELRELIYEITDVLTDDGEIDRPDTCNYMNWHTREKYNYYYEL